jgi:2-keto-3-deoxy-6-phosphogluconate aldolase
MVAALFAGDLSTIEVVLRTDKALQCLHAMLAEEAVAIASAARA